jgi:prepilin-type N-terminal cleavage/methylation domain-containing protein
MFKKLVKLFSRNQKGFTLIELLIVIAVLGVITAIAVPLVSGALSNGKVAAANMEIASVKVAAQAYATGHSTATIVTSDDLYTDNDLSVKPPVTYTISLPDTSITSVNPTSYPGLKTSTVFSVTDQKWK